MASEVVSYFNIIVTSLHISLGIKILIPLVVPNNHDVCTGGLPGSPAEWVVLHSSR